MIFLSHDLFSSLLPSRFFFPFFPLAGYARFLSYLVQVLPFFPEFDTGHDTIPFPRTFASATVPRTSLGSPLFLL